MNEWTDPIHVEDLFIADDFEQASPDTAARMRSCHTHAEFEAVRTEVVELFDRVLGRD